MDSLEPIRILILSKQIHTINKILSTLRNEGVGLNAKAASNKTEFDNKIKFQNWDLILCGEDSFVPINIVKEILKTQNLALPIIFLTDINSTLKTAELLSIDINDCLPINLQSKIISSIKRETGFQRLKLSHRILQLEFKELEKRHHTVLDASAFPLAYIQEGLHLYCNDSYTKLFSPSDPHALEQSPLLDLFQGESRKQLKNALSQKVDSEFQLVLRLNNKLQDTAPNHPELMLSFAPISFKGKACLQLTVKPASGNPAYSEQIITANNQDLLTKLYNKRFFHEKIELAVSKAIKQQQHSSLLVIQLNEFLDIKSTIGLSKANQVLNDVGVFLRNSIQKMFAAARLEDYEFGLLIDNCRLAESIELANFIKSKINNHITTAVLPSMQLSCSIGVAVINENALDAQDLVSKARLNLHKKLPDLGNSNARDHQNIDIVALTTYINLALTEKRFKLLFQPILGLRGEYFHDYEVLSRMLDTEGNEMLPSEFLPLADLNGAGESLDKAVISLALIALNKATNENIRLIISLTSNTLLSKTFLPWLREALQSNTISTDKIFFQISETQICNNLEYCTKFSDSLQALGLSCIVCHYGCVAQPENYLDDIKPVYVKLDKSLVRDIGFSHYQHNELKNLFTDLHYKQIKVAVPQVENSSILPLLWKLGADFIQGYYLERPLQTMNYKFIQHYDVTSGVQIHNKLQQN